MGPAVKVRAQTGLLAHQRIAVEDVAMATLRFASGAMGVIEASNTFKKRGNWYRTAQR